MTRCPCGGEWTQRGVCKRCGGDNVGFDRPAPDEDAKLVERLRKNSGWRNEAFQCVTDPTLLIQAADRIENLRIASLGDDGVREALNMCEHGADKGSYCGYCGGYSQGKAR